MRTFSATGQTLELTVVYIAASNDPDESNEVYAIGTDNRWAAIARKATTKYVLGVYEFFAGAADLFDEGKSGAQLKGKGLVVDADHLRRGIGESFLRNLYNQGILVVPSQHLTLSGAALMNKLDREGLVPTPGAVTHPWPFPGNRGAR
jgi:hypothetical protein